MALVRLRHCSCRRAPHVGRFGRPRPPHPRAMPRHAASFCVVRTPSCRIDSVVRIMPHPSPPSTLPSSPLIHLSSLPGATVTARKQIHARAKRVQPRARCTFTHRDAIRPSHSPNCPPHPRIAAAVIVAILASYPSSDNSGTTTCRRYCDGRSSTNAWMSRALSSSSSSPYAHPSAATTTDGSGIGIGIGGGSGSRSILVVGSMNADTFLRVRRLPKSGENLTLVI